MPGIDFSNDPLLAGRIHSYVDTQISRLGGPNFHEIPVNAPIAQAHNNQRDGMHRQAINRGRVAYEPNSLGGGCPFQAGARGFTSFPEPTAEDKVRGKPEKFADHYTQARLFWNSQTPVEKAHIIRGFRFELTKVQVPAIRKRMVASLANVADELVEGVAEGLGMEVPAPLPQALERPRKPEVETSPALSLFARPGDGGIRTRRIAILVADGIDGEAVKALHAGLLEAGAVPRIVGARLGQVETEQGEAIDVEVTLETGPAVLYDALAVPGGHEAMQALGNVGHALEFVKDQYRHCKPILAMEDGKALVENAGVPARLESGEPDPGLLLLDGDAGGSAASVHRGDRQASALRAGNGSAGGVTGNAALGCRHQFVFTRRHLLAELIEVKLALFHLGKHLGFLFLHVVLDLLCQHRKVRREHRIIRLHALELLDQDLGRVVLDLRLVHEVLVADRFAHRRIEDLLFDRGVHLQLVAHRGDELLQHGGVLMVHLLEFLERFLHARVVCLQQLDRVRGLVSGLCRFCHGYSFGG